MQNFFYDVPTKVAFGKGQIRFLPEFIRNSGSRVLLLYGGGSIKRSGLYDEILRLLDEHKIFHEELSGVEPNPRITTVRKGIALCREKQLDVLLPVGGGSTIDCAKAIAAGFYYAGDPWDFSHDSKLITKVLPIVTVVTLAATGSEMDNCAVISNDETQEKLDIINNLLYPKYSILDPIYTMSVPKYQTAAGTADIMSHIFELYFNGVQGAYMQERMMEALLKTCIHYGPIACDHPKDYDARANLLWTSSWAINGFLCSGKNGGWPCHAMEYPLSAYYNVTHGHGLAVLTPVWMEYILGDKTVEMFRTYGENVFGICGKNPYHTAKEAIARTKQVYVDMGLSTTLKSLGISGKEKFDVMAKQAVPFCEDYIVPLKQADIVEIYRKAYE